MGNKTDCLKTLDEISASVFEILSELETKKREFIESFQAQHPIYSTGQGYAWTLIFGKRAVGCGHATEQLALENRAEAAEREWQECCYGNTPDECPGCGNIGRQGTIAKTGFCDACVDVFYKLNEASQRPDLERVQLWLERS